MKRLLFALTACACAAMGCDVRTTFEEPAWSLERMIDQPRVRAYDPSEAWEDGRGMRMPPPGTVPASVLGVDRVRLTGLDGDAYAARIPLPLTPALLSRGRDRFGVVCATCHGVTGTGESIVAEKMAYRRPPSLHEARIRAYPPGRIFAIVRGGFGLMPSFGAMLDVDDRWAVIAYLRALWLSRDARVADLPASVRRELEESAP
jgi:mono/diheme cytochrome c family protein